MASFALAFGGVSLLLLVFTDFLYTTLSTSGSGLLSRVLSRWIWNAFFWASRGRGQSKLLAQAGMYIVVTLLVAWIVLLWVGNTLIFYADPNSIRQVGTNLPASFWQKAYYVGYALSTMGNGDFYAPANGWKIFTIVVSFSGLSLVTIGITYLIQVTTSEISKRQLGLLVATLGDTPQDILLNGWDGTSFDPLASELTGLTPQILAHSQHHLAYPIIHYFHSSRLRESASLNLVALDEALTILLTCVPPEARGSELAFRSLRKSLTVYFYTLEEGFIEPEADALVQPNLERLRTAGIPLVEDPARIDLRYEQLADRRRVLHAVLRFNGWTEVSLQKPKFTNRLDLFRK